MARIVAMPASVAIGRLSGWRSGLRSMNGRSRSSTRQSVGMPMVAMNTSSGGLTTRSSSKRKKKYHSGRGVYVVVVGSALGPSSAPNSTAIRMMTASTKTAMNESLATAYGKNGLPCDFRTWYSRRYFSFSRAFMAGLDLFLGEVALLLGLQPRRGRGAELGDQVEVRADQRRDQAGHQQHVQRVEAADRGRPELRAAAEEVGEVGPDHRPRRVDVDGHDRGPERALVERQQVARQRHHQREQDQDDADDPVQLARVLVGAEEERPAHVQEHQDDHHRRAPAVHAADELAGEDLVVDVLDRGVRLVGRRPVVHRQEDAGHGLGDEREHRRRAQRVEPVRALRGLAEHEAAGERAQARALVDPADDRGRDLGGGLLHALALKGLLLLGALAVLAVDDGLVALA